VPVYLISPETATSHGAVSEVIKVDAEACKQRFQGGVN
jgi:hypothetical protein